MNKHINIPEGWTEYKIKDILDPVNTLNSENKDLEVLSCTKYDGLVPSLKYFGRKVYGNNLSKYKLVPRGYFAYATNHLEEGSVGYQNLVDFGLVSPMYTVFKVKESYQKAVNPLFLLKLLKSPHMINIYKKIMSASVERRGGLRWGSFSDLKVVLPSLLEQNKIVNIENTWTDAVNVESKKLALLKEQRRHLLNNLITGQIRVPEFASHN